MKAIFPNIEAERVRMGYSKEQMAEKLNVAYKTYYNWMQGVTPIPSTSLIRLAKMSGVTVDYLLGLKGERL